MSPKKDAILIAEEVKEEAEASQGCTPRFTAGKALLNNGSG
jgi:hypothetical protein